MSTDPINSPPSTWPAFAASILNKVGFMGGIPVFLIFIIITCGNDAQKAQLVSAIYFQHENVIYSIAFWLFMSAIIINYFCVKYMNWRKKSNALIIQEQQMRGKDVKIEELRQALFEMNPDHPLL